MMQKLLIEWLECSDIAIMASFSEYQVLCSAASQKISKNSARSLLREGETKSGLQPFCSNRIWTAMLENVHTGIEKLWTRLDQWNCCEHEDVNGARCFYYMFGTATCICSPINKTCHIVAVQ